MVESLQGHYIFGKNMLGYLNGTLIHYDMWYTRHGELLLHEFVNFDCIGDVVSTQKSTPYHYFSLGLGMISQFDRKERVVAINSIEFEYIPACSASCEAISFVS
jgi:hypothetical protein